MTQPLHGRRIRVTGGASGIGAAAVQVLSEAGAGIVATYHRTPPAEHAGVKWVQRDVRDAGAVDDTVKGAAETLGARCTAACGRAVAARDTRSDHRRGHRPPRRHESQGHDLHQPGGVRGHGQGRRRPDYQLRLGDSPAPPATPEDLAERADLVKALDRRIVTAEVDVRDYDALRAAVDSGVEQLGGLDIIVANAGIGTVGTRLDRMKEDIWQKMIDVNLSGVWKSVKAGVPHPVAGGRGGSIILTSSVAGLKTYPHTGHYGAAKHGVVGLMRTFAVELGAQSIRANSVHPTHVNTPLLLNERTFRMFRPDLENPGPDDMAPVCQTFHMLPIPWVTAEDISNAVLFLASDEARYITGVALPVDAGSCLK